MWPLTLQFTSTILSTRRNDENFNMPSVLWTTYTEGTNLVPHWGIAIPFILAGSVVLSCIFYLHCCTVKLCDKGPRPIHRQSGSRYTPFWTGKPHHSRADSIEMSDAGGAREMAAAVEGERGGRRFPKRNKHISDKAFIDKHSHRSEEF